MVTVILTCVYIAGAYFFWKRTFFTGARKLLFALTILPVFFGGMFLSIYLADTFFSELMHQYQGAQLENAELATQGIRSKTVRRAEAGYAFLISVPVALIAAICWFMLFRTFEKKEKSGPALNKPQIDHQAVVTEEVLFSRPADAKRKRIFQILGMVVGIIFIAAGAVEYASTHSIKSFDQTAFVGSIDNYTISRSSHYATFTFVANNGNVITKTQSFPRELVDDFRSKRPVKIYYDPSNPSEFVFEKSTFPWLTVTIGLGIFLISAFVYRRSRKES